MPGGAFRLVLDTHAPNVVWGDVTGASAGALLRMEYVADEPLAGAELVDAGGRRLTLSVFADHVEVLLPVDTPDGWATVEVVDDVGNKRTFTALVSIGGVAPPPPLEPAPVPGVPGVRPRRRARVMRQLVESTTDSVTEVLVVAAAALEDETAVLTEVRARARAVSTSRTEIETAVSAKATARVTSDSGRRLGREAHVTRRDGPDTEALLLLL